ncbi:MAG: phosphoribosylamine--glycine ligase [Candidatus Omnitrophota bacterium]
MKILLIGSGGREHALAWKMAQSRQVKRIFCAPGNGGISDLAECVDIRPDAVTELLGFAKQEKIDLTVVGPEAPLVAGIVDTFREHRLKIFGPEKNAAQLEASKVFAKRLMKKYAVPTAAFRSFEKVAPAKEYVRQLGVPLVIKADGLAQGKGVVVANSIEEVEQSIVSIMEDRVFGDAGKKIIVEECLQGQEASIIVFTDGKHVVPLASSQDHKRIFEQDKGPNTGGMGAYSPAPVVSEKLFQEVMDTIIEPTIKGLASEGIVYQGVLYAGIMRTAQGPKVLEFNVRFGDPETQAILPRLDSDLVEAMCATIEGRLNNLALKWKEQACVCVVCASKGYPGAYEKAKEIMGLKEAGMMKDVVVFHAGTEKKEGKYFTSGGRVLGVTGLGATVKDAIDNAYRAAGKIHFEGMHFRRDIGQKALLLKDNIEA